MVVSWNQINAMSRQLALVPAIEAWSLEEIQVGFTQILEAEISEADIEAFSVLSGDINPLHMSPEFARDRGFQGRVVHGALLTALVSRLIGTNIEEWDSLSHITLVLAVEKEFGVRLNAAEVGRLANVGEMISLLTQRATR